MRIGAVSYLNTKPLVYRLDQLAPQHEVVLDLPSRLADRLREGSLDVALIPSIEFLQHESSYLIVSDACIACRGPVRSVKLFSRVPLERVRTLALDEGSRTSAALVQILLAERLGVRPRLVPFPIDAAPEAIDADALLMIGDRAMHRPPGQFAAEWDLGDVWCRWTELPFVFAMWVARRDGSEEAHLELAPLLERARDAGLANVAAIAEREHMAVGITREECVTYLREHLHFRLGPRELAGLARFRDHAVKRGIIPIPAGARSTEYSAQYLVPNSSTST